MFTLFCRVAFFFFQLLLTFPTAVRLSLQYELTEPNSAWNWLERWSIFRFWVPPVQTKKILKAKPQRKAGSTHSVEPEAGKSRRTVRKVPTAASGENGTLASSETDKPKRNPRKVPSNQTELVQEQAQNELERVKRNLRRVSSSGAAAPEKPEKETEKPQPLPQTQSVEIATDTAAPVVPEHEAVISSENPGDSDAIIDKVDMLEAPSTEITTGELVDVPHDDNRPVAVETHSSENGVKMEAAALTTDDALSCKEEENGKENHKIRKRRSLPAKQEYPENISQNSPSLPSYMAATKSAKAKLKAQGSSKIGEDGAEYGNARRHSLPASTNSKLTSLSPRIQKPVQANGKGASKTNRSLTASRDGKQSNFLIVVIV